MFTVKDSEAGKAKPPAPALIPVAEIFRAPEKCLSGWMGVNDSETLTMAQTEMYQPFQLSTSFS
jgi:hypothetical protein